MSAIDGLIRGDEIEERPVEWLWENRIPLGMLTMLYSKPDTGKSLVACDIAARVTKGLPFPEGNKSPKGKVLFINGEESLGSVFKARMRLAKAASKQWFFMSNPLFTFTNGIEWVEERLIAMKTCRLVVIDSCGCFLGDVNENSNSEIRAMLFPWELLAEEYNIAILLISHMRKGSGDAQSRLVGSIGWMAAVRSAYVLGEDSRDGLVFAPSKFSLVPKTTMSLKLQIDSEGAIAYISWMGVSDVTAEELVGGGTPTRGRPPKERDLIKELLTQMLSNHPRKRAEVIVAMKVLDHSSATVDRAAKALGVKTVLNKWILPLDNNYDN